MPRKKDFRPQRNAFGEIKNTVTLTNMDENYTYRLVNDVDNRIKDLESAGYEIVHGAQEVGDPSVDQAHHIGSVVSRPVGGGITGIMMRIKKEWYDDAQKQKAAYIDSTEESLRHEGAKEGRYGSVKIGKSKTN